MAAVRAVKAATQETLHGVSVVRAALYDAAHGLRRRKLDQLIISRTIPGALEKSLRHAADQAQVTVRTVHALDPALKPPGHHAEHAALVCSTLRVPQPRNKELMNWQKNESGLRILVLDAVQDPMNVGALLRSALFFGLDGCILGPNCSTLSPTVSRASAGALELLPVAITSKALAGTLQHLRTPPFNATPIGACLDMQDERWHPLSACPTDPFALVLGNEGFGLRAATKDVCPILTGLPPRIQPHHFQLVDSLNVSVAGAAIMAHLQQHQSPPTP